MSDKITKSPPIRFSGFMEAWEQRRLDKILKERKVKQKITKELPLLAFASGQGVIDRSERKTNNRDFLTKDSTKKIYLLTKYNDIVYNPSNLKYGAIDRNKHGQGVISPIYVTFETDEIPSFIELIVKSETFKQRALQYEEGTVTKRQSVKPENLLCLNVVLPNSKDEQKKIGKLFEQIDDMITLHQRKLDLLKVTKKSMLQKMFPKDGESVPEIRFAGFTNAWEQRKLGEIGEFKNGMNFGKEAMGHGHPFVNLQDIFGKNIVDDSNLALAESSENQRKEYCLNKGDVLFIRSSVKPEGVGEAALVPRDFLDTTYSGFIIRFRAKVKMADKFKKFVFSTKEIRNQIMASATSSANTNINQDSLKKIQLKSPVNEEQNQIGEFFENLDNLITLHQRELDLLKDLKKSMLQQMFI